MSSKNVNKVILVAQLGHNPNLRYTAKGTAVTTLSLATDRESKNAAGEKIKETHWHRATLWGRRAEACAKYLAKGSRVYLEGELLMKNWTNKEGHSQKSSEILVDKIHFLSRPANSPSPEISLAQSK